jgi:hypothetical protein
MKQEMFTLFVVPVLFDVSVVLTAWPRTAERVSVAVVPDMLTPVISSSI